MKQPVMTRTFPKRPRVIFLKKWLMFTGLILFVTIRVMFDPAWANNISIGGWMWIGAKGLSEREFSSPKFERPSFGCLKLRFKRLSDCRVRLDRH